MNAPCLEALEPRRLLDTVAPTIIASSILENDHITPPTISYTAVFSEAMATAGLSTSEMSLIGQTIGSRSITNFNYDPETFTLTATFASLPRDSYTLTLTSSASAFRDVAGNLLDGERNTATTVPAGDGTAGGHFVVHFTVPFAVTSTGPAEGTVLINPLTTINVNFNGSVASSSVNASDLLINGQPALSVSTIDIDTMRFTLPTLSEGLNIITIAEGSITSLVGSHPIAAYSGSVIINRIGPRVIASSILHGEDVAPGHFVYVATFDEPMDADRLDVTDVTLVGLASGSHVAQSLLYDDATRSVAIDFGVLPADYYTLSLLSNGIGFRDSGNQYLDGERNPSGTIPSGDGQPLGDFVIEFQFEDPAGTPFPVPLEQRFPLGSMVYEGEFTTTLAAADTDTFLVPLDAGQRLNILVRPTAELRVGVVVRDAGGAVLFSEESLTGMPVVLNHLMSTGSNYEIAITSLDGSTGDASLNVSLNAAFETESVRGAGNDSPDAAQDIVPAFSTMGSEGGSIANVAGRAGRVIYSETYSNDLFAPNVLTFDIPDAPLPENNTSFSWGFLTITAVGDLDAASDDNDGGPYASHDV